MTKEDALAALESRKLTAPEKIDNSKLHAGSPMYFYCGICGHISDVLPEDYMTQPKRICAPCQILKSNEWI